MWSWVIFDDSDLTQPSSGQTFNTYAELTNWLVAVIMDDPAKDFRVSFQVPTDATEAQLKALGMLGPTNFVRS